MSRICSWRVSNSNNTADRPTSLFCQPLLAGYETHNTSVYSHHDISTELTKSFSEELIQIFPDACNFGHEQFKINNFFKRTSNFTLLARKRNDAEAAEEYCWAITHAKEWSCCGGSDFSVLQFGFQLYSYVYTDICVSFYVINTKQMHYSFLIYFSNLSSTCFK